MASKSRFRIFFVISSLFSAGLAFLGSAISTASNAVIAYYSPPRPDDALALDRVAHVSTVDADAARAMPFKAFADRALSHAMFDGWGFGFGETAEA